MFFVTVAAMTTTPLMTPLRKKIGMFACLATICLAVLDMNIVSAATVPIVRELDPVHGVDKVAWLVSAFALASTAALPLYGKLCDVLGAKPVFLGAVGTFMAGSILCGFATDMPQLIAFRAIQGVGGGGLMGVTMVVIAKIHEGEADGGRGGGSLGGLVGGLGMGIGPVVGGLFADAGNWRWIFWINIPLGIAIMVVGAVVLRLRHTRVAHRVDFLGAGLAAAFTSGALLVTEWGGVQFDWTSPVILGVGAASVIALGLFVWRQATAAEPILPLTLFRIPTVRLSFAIQAFTGVAMMGTMVYLMVYLQVARGIEATDAGMFMIPLAAGLFVIGIVTGRLMKRGWSTRSFVISGTGFGTAALALLALTGAETSLWIIRGEMFLFGIGMGQLLGLLVVAAQQAAPRHQIGVATTGVRLFQTLGGAFGAAIFGTLLNRTFAAAQPGLTTASIPGLGAGERRAAVESFVSSVDLVFAAGAVFMGLALLLALRLKTAAPRTASAPEPAMASS